MARIYLKRTLAGFSPADESSNETARKYNVGEIYRADIVKPRNYKHHCQGMALLDLTYQNLPERYEQQWPTFKAFRRAMAEAAGHVEEYTTLGGEVRRSGRSLSYDEIPDDVEFGQVLADMLSVCAHLLGVEEPEIAAEVSRYASDKYGVAA